jgi:S1-C subfamily serine protease
MSDEAHSILITDDNPQLAALKKSWVTAQFSAEDGIGPMASLHQAGDSIVVVASLTDEGMMAVGSGVMIGPGLMLTANHVLKDFPQGESGPVCLTFLQECARAWLPRGHTTAVGPSAFDQDRRRVSDLTLVSCSLNSEAHEQYLLTLAPIKLALPLIGERLWAFGYRHGDIVNGTGSLGSYVSSGLVTACFPDGRGERMPSSCIEVAMDTIGGMSGGPVVNDDGWLVGIVSSSLEGGPSYVTLLWDALRLSASGAPRCVWPVDEADLFLGRDLGLIHIKGDVTRDEAGNVVMTLSTPEIEQLAKYADPASFEPGGD